jgi:uncharacterized OB-fold protein
MEQMYAYQCTKCGKLHHPRYVVCQNPDCDGREFKEVPLGGKCKLLTWTRVYNLPEGYMQPWLNFGVVEFENGVRVTGQIALTKELKAEWSLSPPSASFARAGFSIRKASTAKNTLHHVKP